MKVQAIIAAAGEGKRLKGQTLKPFVLVNGIPLIIYTLRNFENCQQIKGVVLVVPGDKLGEFEDLVGKYGLAKVSRIVAGGASRQESVYNGLAVIDHDTQLVVVHDGARPLADAALIEKAVTAAQQHEAVVTAVPVKPTIKRVDPGSMTVTETIVRKDLWEIQTPQVFKKDILLKAHRQKSDKEATDDAMLIEQIGIKVKIVEGDYLNIKVTTQEDVAVVEALMSRKEQG